MTLDELVEQVVDDRVTLNSILLKAKVLAYNLHADNLKIWLEGEINGYGNDTEVPDYRRNVPVRSHGTLTNGAFIVNNHPVPVHLLPDNVADFSKRIDIRQSISSIQSLIDKDEGDSIYVEWPSEYVAYLNTIVVNELNGAGYINVRNGIGRISFQAILDNTRNRLPTFLMELREQYPNLDISKSTADFSTSRTAQILVTNHIYGNENIVASGREFTQSVTKSIKDLDSLLSHLQDLGVEEKDLETLEQAMTTDQQTGQRGIGSNVRSWLGNFTAGVASSHVATNLPQIVEAIGTFLGQ